MTTPKPDAVEALRRLLDACLVADLAGDLPSEIDGSLLDYASDTLAAEAQRPEPASDDADRLLLRELFAVCEATEDACADTADVFKRGRAFEAKRIRRGVGTWYQDTFCGPTHMGEPLLAAHQHPHASGDAGDTVPWPVVTSYSGGAAAEGLGGRLWVRMGDGLPYEYVLAAGGSEA